MSTNSFSDVTAQTSIHLSLPIAGMGCASCVGRVEAALKQVPGVIQVAVNLAAERADIQAVAVDQQTLRKNSLAAITQAGYSVPSQSIELSITGMSCASCVGRVEKALLACPGVETASVNLATERASIQGQASADELVQAIAQAGYQARLIDTSAQAQAEISARKQAQQAALKRELILASLLALPVFTLEMGSHMIPSMHHWIMNHIGTQNSWYLQCALTTLVLLFPGRDFYQQGIPALIRRAPDMNSLVAVGTAAAYAYSLVATFMPVLLPAGTVHVYFEAAAVIIALILFGRYMEARAKGRTSAAIQKLIGLRPNTAHVLRDGQITDLNIDAIVLDDILEVRPGERVPVDGVVTEGRSFVDEAMITGEPLAVEKTPGSSVTGGTINQQGALRLRATAIGGQTLLAQIIRMVEQAQGSKLPIQTVVDKITLRFVPAVMLAALLTFFVWLLFGSTPALGLALVNAVAVLIIACPCAMGLATPTSIMVGTGRGAELGVLFRQGEALQLLKDVRVVAVDKTGTLTKGQPELTDLETTAGFEPHQVLAAVAALEARSEHPIARAIVQAAENAQLSIPPLNEFQAIAGMGIHGHIASLHVAVGADRYMQELGLDVSVFASTAERLADEGKSPLYAALDGRLAAILAVSDPIKPSTPAAIQALHRLGLKVVMITGDNTRTAQAIARQLNIDEVIAEVLPAGKVAAVEELKVRHGRLAFVGDGINDAPALAAADIGLAIGGGTDIAADAADVVLVSGHLTGVATAIELSQATIRNIQQNLFWAFAYNTALIPVAAGLLHPFFGLLLSPVFAAAAMALSSVFVLSNALRLRRFQPANA